jgi:hypothetical protein
MGLHRSHRRRDNKVTGVFANGHCTNGDGTKRLYERNLVFAIQRETVNRKSTLYQLIRQQTGLHGEVVSALNISFGGGGA